MHNGAARKSDTNYLSVNHRRAMLKCAGIISIVFRSTAVLSLALQYSLSDIQRAGLKHLGQKHLVKTFKEETDQQDMS